MITRHQKKTVIDRLSISLLCFVMLFILFDECHRVNGRAQHPVPSQQEQLPPVEPTLPQNKTFITVTTMDYKVIIDPGKEDCYFQFVNPGATFYVSVQVIIGGDGMAGISVRHPNGQIVRPYQWKASLEYQDKESTGGDYSVCINNQFSKFAAKLVNLYITVDRYDKWDEHHKEIKDMNVSVENFTVSF